MNKEKKVGLILGRSEGLRDVTVSLQDDGGKYVRSRLKESGTYKKWRKTMQEVGPSLKVTPVFTHHRHSVYPSVSKGYYNGLYESN